MVVAAEAVLAAGLFLPDALHEGELLVLDLVEVAVLLDANRMYWSLDAPEVNCVRE